MKWIITNDNGYRFDRRIFWGALFLILLLLVPYISRYGFNYQFYYNCKKDVCSNPYRDMIAVHPITHERIVCPYSWCEDTYLTRGEYGVKPSAMFTNFPIIISVLFAVALILNHLIYNKGKTFSLQLALSKETRDKIKEAFKDEINNNNRKD